jgi:hypothetical protein
MDSAYAETHRGRNAMTRLEFISMVLTPTLLIGIGDDAKLGDNIRILNVGALL